MGTTPCYDCGTPMDAGTRGCPQCGRNFVAERAAARWLAWCAIVALSVAVAAIAVWSLRR
jgi:hypothetical protein